MSAGGRYARIVRTPHVMPLMVAALLARLPIGIDSIAIVLFLRERTGSYATAGIVSAAFALGGGAGEARRSRPSRRPCGRCGARCWTETPSCSRPHMRSTRSRSSSSSRSGRC